ncbi:MAG: DNA replication and repair protein RecF [Chloroflexi bacterium]|nr:DNA replication and repair protein RecF [Chloroflexota bacterium]
MLEWVGCYQKLKYPLFSMYITQLSLTNFRNYGRLELDLPLGPSLIHGNNAQGKTNLLEAIYYLATSRSPHASQDQQLINWVAMQAEEPVIVGRLVAQLVTAQGKRLVEIRLIYERSQSLRQDRGSFRREALVDKRKVRLMDLLGNLQVVLFLPEDVQIITGPPSKRRRYMDITLCQVDPLYCRHLSHYNKVLEQRNALLRQIAEGAGSREVLPIYTEKLVRLGSQVFARRSRVY